MRSHRNEYMVGIFDTSDFSTQRGCTSPAQSQKKRHIYAAQNANSYAADVLLVSRGGNL